MLDDLKIIHERDLEDALGTNEKQPEQLLHEFGVQYAPPRPILNVVLAGMGGSALGALFVQRWPGLPVPFEVVRDYALPTYVGEQTLVIASSYSGNTEETLAALDEAQAKNAMIVVLAGGGALTSRAHESGLTLYELPKASQPRYAVFYSIVALMELFVSCGLVPQAKLDELRAQADWLRDHVRSWLPIVPVSQNKAKQLAQEVIGRSAVIYSGPELVPAAYKWKISFNENAKHLAWWNQYSEFNHNEFIGWSKQPQDKPYCVIDLRSHLYNLRVQKRFEVSERLLSGLRPAPHVVEVQGDTLIQQLLWSSVLGDFVSLYTALLNGVNPAPVELVERFKKALNE